ncbi:hypothetical protein LTR85_001792 [Meristemomyces frigidus]|nr:hypothetical protein LTR85_001792 [Meristemomyces frigidus]
MVNRWPALVRRTLDRTDRTDSVEKDPFPPPFHSWAQPRYMERRKQAVAVLYTLLHFLLSNWSGYGGKDSPLHSLGLEPSRDQYRLGWPEPDTPAPDADNEPDRTLPAWLGYHDALRQAVNEWLPWGCAGPMCEILSLRDGALPPRRLALDDPPLDVRSWFVVKYAAVYDRTRDPIMLSDVYPATAATRYRSPQAANTAAVDIIASVLRRERKVDEHEDDMLTIDDMDETFTLGEDLNRAVQ